MQFLKKIVRPIVVVLGLLIGGILILFGYQDIPLETLKETYANTESQFMALEGMEVHYRDEGPKTDSIPIVLIHGTGASLHTFDDWTYSLSKYRRVLRMDLPAYGLTGPFMDRNYSTQHYVAFIAAFLDELGVEYCVLAGNSLGGKIAWNFTSAYPDRVDRLVLIDASGYPTGSSRVPIAFQLAQLPVVKQLFTFITPRFVAASSVKNVYADPQKVAPEVIDRYFELTLRSGNRQAFVDKLNTPVTPFSREKVMEIQQPTLILWGAEDRLIPLEVAQQFHKDLPNSTLVVIDNLGHVPMEEDPERSIEPVLQFLNLPSN